MICAGAIYKATDTPFVLPLKPRVKANFLLCVSPRSDTPCLYCETEFFTQESSLTVAGRMVVTRRSLVTEHPGWQGGARVALFPPHDEIQQAASSRSRQGPLLLRTAPGCRNGRRIFSLRLKGGVGHVSDGEESDC